jgi:hypothetical protein
MSREQVLKDHLYIQFEPGTETVDPAIGLRDFRHYSFDTNFGLILRHDTSPQRVVIDGGGRTIQLGGSSRNKSMVLITVGEGVTLTLQNITLKGFPSNEKPLVRVSGGTLILEAGTVITDNGRGVFVGGLDFGGGGSLVMHGGSIRENVGNGVIVGNQGTFAMDGGVISNNSSGGWSHGGGGVHIHSGGRFTLEGGEIHQNVAWGFDQSGNGGGVYVRAGGVFVMRGGELRGNTASGDFGTWGLGGPAYGGGVYVEKARALLTDSAGAVMEDRGASFVKTGGIIYGQEASAGLRNTTAKGRGEAVYVGRGPARQREATAAEHDDLNSDTDEGWEPALDSE